MKELILNNLFGLVATLVVSFSIYFLQERKAKSADRERIKQTKKEIVDTIEAYIINNQNISESVILNFKNGIERANEVVIEKDWDSIALLQDISFRLQSSRHLAVDQKLTYANKLDQLISEWSSAKKLTLAFNDNDESEIVSKILELIDADKKTNANKYISELLASRRYHRTRNLIEKTERIESIQRLLTSLIIGLGVTSFITVILQKISEEILIDQSFVKFSFFTPTKVLLLICILVLLFAITMIFKFIRNAYLNKKDPFRYYRSKYRL
ncbi:hypothetical protein [Acinetobacter bereziniae]|uniref:hypothetical protein n=1 Tax=Acinetobacter bereziniae TaxID=106648 RepID=UPI00066778A6|nr:hypothetical protein [Acinetobacter bereziniae]MBJ8428617.1 hypothetical protein [Acinetobacter bereziniae]MBJ8477636.1 hypothetical protein [Acinetobacter bereziniae]